MSFTRFYDPTGERYGLPSWPWGHAPHHLATRAQLAAKGLRPGGQAPAGQLLWRSRRAARPDRTRSALLYDVHRAKPKRAVTPAMLASLDRALRARRTCPICQFTFTYCLPTSLGMCPACADDDAIDPAELEETT